MIWYPILDTKCSFVRNATGSPLFSEMRWKGDIESNTVFSKIAKSRGMDFCVQIPV